VFFSALGLTALSGVVVNASLVLVDYANRQRLTGQDPVEAILGAATLRFRPIILTSVTTFVGLIPLMSTSTPATAPFFTHGHILGVGCPVRYRHHPCFGALPLHHHRRFHFFEDQRE